MSIFLCAVSANAAKNYQIGINVCRWGVLQQYKTCINRARKGDDLVFLVDREYRSIHRIERKVFKEEQRLWAPENGNEYCWHIEISKPLQEGCADANRLASKISFMRGKDWRGTVRGRNGIFNSRLTPEDLALIREELRKGPCQMEFPF